MFPNLGVTFALKSIICEKCPTLYKKYKKCPKRWKNDLKMLKNDVKKQKKMQNKIRIF